MFLRLPTDRGLVQACVLGRSLLIIGAPLHNLDELLDGSQSGKFSGVAGATKLEPV